MTTHNTTTETEMIETEQKIIALAAHLDIEPDDAVQSDYNPMEFEADGVDYLVCTDEEADDMAADYIKDSLWAVNPGFIIDHSPMPYDAVDLIADFQEAKCEDANATIASLITDMEEFIEDAICADGRGNFLNGYDGEEYESNGFYIYQR